MLRFLMVATLVAVDAHNFVASAGAPSSSWTGANMGGNTPAAWWAYTTPRAPVSGQNVPYTYTGTCANVQVMAVYNTGQSMYQVGSEGTPLSVGTGSHNFGYAPSAFNVFVPNDVTCEISALTIDGHDYMVAGGSADPHLSLAYGGMADFRGINNTFFSMLSSPGINAAFKTTDAVFMLKHGRRVDGSFMTELAVNVMSGTEMFTVRTVAEKETGFYVANAKNEVISRNDKWSTITGDGVVVEQLMLTTSIRAHGWEVNATRKPVYNHVSGPNWRFDFTLRPLADESKWTCHPHGIIGQSFDGTGIGLLGKMDDYEEKNVKTSAMAEGVIEGTAADYIVKPESPTFKYSRFNANDETACKPRDAMTLSGSKIRGSNNMAAGASD